MLVKLLNEELTNQIKELFDGQLIHPVELLYFYNNDACETCHETEQLLDEIATISDHIQINKYDLNANSSIAQKYHVELAPGLVVAGGGNGDPIDYGIRFAGIPSGYEFGSLIQAIVLVSKRDSGLKPEVRHQLKDLKKPIHLQVFVTPT